MSNRETMQQALEALDVVKLQYTQNRHINDAITAIKAALEQPEQEPNQWRDMIVATLVREGINKHRARELADHFAAQRKWVGLTETDWGEIDNKKDTALDSFAQGAVWAEVQLRERNNG